MSLRGMLSLKLGRSIAWDGEKEVILEDPDAKKLLEREHGAPWKSTKIAWGAARSSWLERED